jgi:hypothetical protein
MPNIPIILQEQAEAQVFTTARATGSAFGAGIGESLQQVGRTVEQINEDLIRRRKAEERLRAENLLIQQQTEFLRSQQDRRNAAENLDEYPQQAQEEWGEMSRQAFEASGLGEEAKNYYNMASARWGMSVFGTESTYAIAERGRRIAVDVADNIELGANLIMQDPGSYEDQYAKIEQTVALIPGDQSARMRYAEKYREALTDAYVSALFVDADTVPQAQAFLQMVRTDERVAKDLSPSRLRTLIAGAEQKIETLDKVDLSQFNYEVQNYASRLQNGGATDPRFSDANIRAVVGDATKASKIIDKLDAAQTMGQLRDRVFTARPDELRTMAQEYVRKAQTGTKSDGDIYAAFQVLVNKRNTELARDPVMFAINYDPAVRAASENVRTVMTETEDETMVQTARGELNDRLVQVQQLYGVSPWGINLLSEPELNQLEEQFKSVLYAEGGAAVADKMSEIEFSYGRHWDIVYRQLVNRVPEAIPFTMMQNRSAMNELAQLSGQKLVDMVGQDETKANDLRRKIRAEAEPQLRVFLRNGDNVGANQMVLAAAKMAANKANRQGLELDDAIRFGVDAVFNDKYTWSETYVTPNTYDQRAIDSGVKRLIREFGENDIEIQVPADGTREEMIRAIRARAVPFTAPNDEGVYLHYSLRENGDMDTVNDPDGNPILFRFDDLLEQGVVDYRSTIWLPDNL